MLRKKHRPSASSDRAIHSRTNPLQLVGLARRRNTSGKSEHLGSRTCGQAAGTRYRRKASRVVTRSTSFTGWRQHAALASSLSLVDRLRGRRGNTKMRQRCQRPRSKRISLSRKSRDGSPGATNPFEKRRSGQSELGRRETSGSSSREWRKPLREKRTENAGWRLER
jgi:hypothetical protein